jgi:hypothetical protein
VTDPQPPAPVVPGERVAQALADAERILAAAAVLERRYPAARPDVLDATISELHSIARAWRRIAAAESPESAVEPSASDDTGQASPAAHGQAGPRTSAVPALPVAAGLEDIREPLGRIAHDAYWGWLTEHDGPPHSRPPSIGWGELPEASRGLWMRIGHAVAAYALTENAATSFTDCTRCAGFLDRARSAEERAERAAAGERDRIRALADRTEAVCTGSDGTSHWFSALLGPGKSSTDEEECRG